MIFETKNRINSISDLIRSMDKKIEWKTTLSSKWLKDSVGAFRVLKSPDQSLSHFGRTTGGRLKRWTADYINLRQEYNTKTSMSRPKEVSLHSFLRSLLDFCH